MLQLAIAEDNGRYLQLLQNEVKSIPNSTTTIVAKNGYDLLLQLNNAKQLPTILLLDIEMPKVDGLLVTSYLNLNYPKIKIIGVSSHSNKELVIEVLSEGAIGFISKLFLYRESTVYINAYGSKNIFLDCIDDALNNECFIDKLLYNNTENTIFSKSTKQNRYKKFPDLSFALTEFLILNATNLSFIEISLLMNKSVSSVKHYGDQLAEIFNVKGRRETVTYCINHGLVKLPSYYDKNAS